MADTPQTTEMGKAAAQYAAANPFLRDATVVPGEGIYAQTQGVDLTPQTSHELTLEVQRNIAVLSELASSTTDPEVKAELNAAISQLASVMGAPNARAIMGEILRGAQGAISYAQGGSTGSYSGGASSGTKAAVAAGRMPTSNEIYSSQYVSSSGYVQDGYIDQFLQEFGYSEQTRAAVVHANDVMEGTRLHNDATYMVNAATSVERIDGMAEAVRTARTPEEQVAIVVEGQASSQTMGEIRQTTEDFDEQLAIALEAHDYARVDLILRMRGAAENGAVEDDDFLSLGPFTSEAVHNGGHGEFRNEWEERAHAYSRDVGLSRSLLTSLYEVDPARAGELYGLAEELGIPTVDSQGAARSSGDILYDLSVRSRATPEDPRLAGHESALGLLAAQVEIPRVNTQLYAALGRLQEERPELAAEFATATPERRNAILSEINVAFSEEEQNILAGSGYLLIRDQASMETYMAGQEADIASITVGERPVAMNGMIMGQLAEYATAGATTAAEYASSLGQTVGVASVTVNSMLSGTLSNWLTPQATSSPEGEVTRQYGGIEAAREAALQRMLAMEPPTAPEDVEDTREILTAYSGYYESRGAAAREVADEEKAALYDQQRLAVQMRLDGILSPIAQPDQVLSPDMGAEVSEAELETIVAQDAERLREQAEQRAAEQDPLIDRFYADPSRYMNAEPGTPDAELYREMEDALFYKYHDEVIASGEFPNALALPEAERRVAQALEAASTATPVQETEEERRIREAYAEYATSRTEAAAAPAADTAVPTPATATPDAANPAPAATPASAGLPAEAAAAAAAAAAPAASAGCSSAGVEGTEALTAPPPPSPSAAPPPLAISGVGPS